VSRPVLVTLISVSLLGFACDQAPPGPTPSAQEESDASRGRHRVRQSSQRGAPQTAKVVNVDIPMLDIAVLDQDAKAFEAGRDPFRYGRTKPVKRPPKKVREPDPEPEPVESGLAEPVKPVAPPFPHSFLGSFGSAGLRIAVFEDSEGTVINAFEGEVLEGKWKVLKIGYESVDIEFVGFPDTPAERLEIGS
jgi:hypothetical protein